MNNLKLGMPYMGSKRKLSKPIIDYIIYNNPNAKYFYDLFGGGGAISFEALQRSQFKEVNYNELNTGIVELLKKIRNEGVTEDFYQWVSRETFNKHKNDNDWFGGLLKTCWSFGNNQSGYLFGKYVELNKSLGHNYVLNKLKINGFKDINENCIKERRLFLNLQAKQQRKELLLKNPNLLAEYHKYINILNNKYSKEIALVFTQWLKSTGIKAKEIDELTKSQMSSHYLTSASQPAVPTDSHWELLKKSNKLNNIPVHINELFDKSYKLNLLKNTFKLERLEQLERLQQLEQLDNLIITNQSYIDVSINTPVDETVIYCDPPYRNTSQYQQKLDHDIFNDWVKNSPYKIYVSSYESDLNCVLEMDHRSTLSQTKNNKVIEKLFCNKIDVIDNERFKLI
jgi:site-specific DNA-adenine methylase